MTTGVRDGGAGLPPEPETTPSSTRRRSRHGRRRNWTAKDRAWAAGASGIAAVLGALGDAAPTGNAAVDLLERALFAVVFTVAVARARRWAWLVASCTITVLGGIPIGLVGLVSAWFAVTALKDEHRNRTAGWVVGVLTSFGVLRLPSWGPHGSTAVVTAILLLLAAVSSYRTLRSRTKRNIRRALVVVAIVGVVVVALGGLALSYSRSDIEAAVDRSEESVTEAKAGRTEDAVRAMEVSERRFRSVTARLDGVIGFGGSLVPVLAQHLDAVRQVATDGADISAAGVEVARLVDYRALQGDDGRIDLERLASFAEPLERTRDELAQATDTVEGIDSPWLLPPMRTAIDDAGDRLGELEPGAAVAADMVEVLPAILGGDGERRYLVLLMTQAETRDLAGHIGFYAEVSANDGLLRRVRSGPIRDLIRLNDPPPPLDPDRYPASFLEAEPQRFPQNLGATADLPTTTRAAIELYPQLGGGPIDGVATVDPAGLAALLELTGPIEVAGTDVTLTADNATDFLLREQYVRFVSDDEQDAFGRALIEQVADRLAQQPVTDPSKLGSALGDAAAADNLRFLSVGSDGAEERALGRLGLGEGLAPIEEGADGVAVLVSNTGPNKLDAYLAEEVVYRPVVDPDTGRVEGRLTVSLTNNAPPGLPLEVTGDGYGGPIGTNRVRLSVLSPLDALDVTVDGASVPFGRQDEYGRNRYSRPVTIAPGATVVVEFRLEGTVQLDDGYRLHWHQQPPAARPTVRLTVTDRSGAIWPCPVPTGTVSETLECRNR